MPRLLPDRLATDCIQEYEHGAIERYTDVGRLADTGRRTGAIYLYGYVVEMFLKAAFLRLAGHADEDPIGIATLRGYVGDRPTSTARSLGLPGTANLHDLMAWTDLIVAYRAARGLVYPEVNFAAVLTTNVRTVAQRWTEVLRYHKNVAYLHELNAVRTACSWVVNNRHAI